MGCAIDWPVTDSNEIQPPRPSVPPPLPAHTGSNKSTALVLGAVFGGLFLLFLVFLVLAWAAMKGGEMSTGTGPKIGVVELTGMIGDGKTGIEGRREAEQIREFAEDDGIKAIVVRIDSPGGAVAPSQEIWEEIKRSREKKKVVCSQGNMAASGGYYISVACDEIIANAGTLTGSIGVISQFFDASELVAAAKLEETTLKTGALKDSGSPFRDFNEQDRAYFNRLLDDIYLQFLTAVAEGRGKTVDEIRPFADGRVLTGREAAEAGLVDGIGNFRTAVQRAMELSELTGEPELVYPAKKSQFPFLELLEQGAGATGRALTRGAIDGALTAAGYPEGGVLLLAPGLSPRR